jgi:hypothetical protein
VGGLRTAAAWRPVWGLIGGKARHAQAQEAAAQDAFELACADHTLAEEAHARQLLEARRAHDLRIKAIEAGVREHNAAVDELEGAFRAGVPDAVEEYFGQGSGCRSIPAASRASTRSPTGKSLASWSSNTGCGRWT